MLGKLAAAVRERARVEVEVSGPVPLPVRVLVIAHPRQVRADRYVMRFQRRYERAVAWLERVAATGVEPQAGAHPAAGLPPGAGHEVVTCEVRRVVEGTRRCLAAGAPDRRRMAADRAEAARVEARDVVGAEAAHRRPADR